MNKTIIININGIVFHIEEDAYETLRSYMIDIKRHFGKSEDSKEILEDIENRIAEMFSERIESGRKEVINNEDVNDVIAQMGRVSDFDTADESYGEGYTQQDYTNNQSFSFGKKLMRDPDDTVISGVCSGIGHYVGLEARWVRLLFVLFVLLGGSGILAYVILWIIMPVAITRADKMEMRGEAPNLQNFKKNFEEEMSGFRENFSGAGDSLSQGVRSAGDVIVKILTVFVKAIGLVIAFSIGLSLLGLLIAVIFFAFGISGFSDNGIMYPVNFMEPNQAYIALIAAAFAIAIPMIAIFYSIIRALFNKGSMNKYVSISLFIVWLLATGVSISYGVNTMKDFKEESTIVEEKPLQRQAVYHLSERDVRVIKVEESNTKRIIKIDDRDLSDFLKNNIRVRVEKIDSLKAPYIKYEYSSRGKNYQLATNRASQIRYQVTQDSLGIHFDSHFKLREKELYRDQEVTVTLYLPVGSKVIIDRSLEYKLRDISYYDCKVRYEEDVKETEWNVTDLGLKCAIEPKEETPENQEVTIEQDTINHNDDETNVNISKDGIKITTKNSKDTLVNIGKDGVRIDTKQKDKK
ncbi:PspC domain-containing protein [Sphingobacterium spiritivorum]|uniref:PspC domain protein n=1 Tax=Sphingobacterium spiritivorum ATCC 33861 TaxID=525373 RepID=D7VIM0_SPHSI|nr:PspC domain-containing protein [Sphingobacterium spiritivorum]EFK59922.1 PspC domain protein [Sphingobacterium spiritivorum ATCC 33861]QQT37443.1 PspC domain-containing protein [Sphingobacterium spiritivorum]WQD34237.1 PspC domain-containing protein [Sphingobacterium spiritivorum]SUI97060.1 DNA-binding transcriptional activator PspC [Sphingobacterium spiritivorum]